jgi:hypothetical protein
MTRPSRPKKTKLQPVSDDFHDTEPVPPGLRELDPADLRRRDAQIALIALGYLDINTREIIGEPKGAWGPESRTGLTAFLRDHELPVTDELDATSYRGILAAYDAALEARASAAADIDLSSSDHEKRQSP